MEALRDISEILLGRGKLLSKKRTLTTYVFNYPKTTFLAWLVFWSPMLLVRRPGIGQLLLVLVLALCAFALSLIFTRLLVDDKNHVIMPKHLLLAWRDEISASWVNPTWRQQELVLLETVKTWSNPGLRPSAKVLEPAMRRMHEISGK